MYSKYIDISIQDTVYSVYITIYIHICFNYWSSWYSQGNIKPRHCRQAEGVLVFPPQIKEQEIQASLCTRSDAQQISTFPRSRWHPSISTAQTISFSNLTRVTE